MLISRLTHQTLPRLLSSQLMRHTGRRVPVCGHSRNSTPQPHSLSSGTASTVLYSTMLLAAQPLPHTHRHIIADGNITKGFPAEEFSARRLRFAEKLAQGSIAVIPARKVMHMTSEIPYTYRQNSDFYYLTGFMSPDACLVVAKDINNTCQVHMFVEEKDDRAEKWSGPRTGVDVVQELFGFDKGHVLPYRSLVKHLGGLISDPQYTVLYYDHEKPVNDHVQGLLSQLFGEVVPMRSGGAKLGIMSPRRMLDKMRCVKSPREIHMLRECGRISGEAFVGMMRGTYPGMSEAHIEALLEFEVRLRGAQRLAYPPVVASGEHRSNIIHYVVNNREVQDGDLVVVDGAAEYYLYSCDITRTYPVSGRFTDPQREIYEAVLRVQEKCIELCNEESKMDLGTLHRQSELFTFEELRALGICDNMSDVAMFYPHSIGHPMGMDIHEHAPSAREPLKEGMVITIEPGIYIPPMSETENNSGLNKHERYVLDRIPAKYRGIGVRIEDDVVIGKESCEVLTAAAPKQVEEIERIMGERIEDPMSSYVKRNFRH